MWWSAIGRANRSKSAGKTRNTERLVCRWQNDRKRGQPAKYMFRRGTSSVATQDVAPTCAHLTALARTFSSRQLAIDSEDGGAREYMSTGGAFWQSGAARCSRARSCSVAIRDGRCDNDDATFDSFPLIYIGGCISVTGEVNAAAGRSSSERA